MPFCPECGFPIDTQKYCPNCGTKQEPIAYPPRKEAALDGPQGENAIPTHSEKAHEVPTAGVPGTISEDHTIADKRPAIKLPFRMDVLHHAVSTSKDLTSEFSEKDTGENSAYAVLCYCSFLVFIPLLNSKGSSFVRFHVTQGFNVFIATILTLMGRSIILELVDMLNWGDAVTGFLSVAFSIPFLIVLLGLVGLSILGISNAIRGRARVLPYIGRFDIFESGSVAAE